MRIVEADSFRPSSTECTSTKATLHWSSNPPANFRPFPGAFPPNWSSPLLPSCVIWPRTRPLHSFSKMHLNPGLPLLFLPEKQTRQSLAIGSCCGRSCCMLLSLLGKARVSWLISLKKTDCAQLRKLTKWVLSSRFGTSNFFCGIVSSLTPDHQISIAYLESVKLNYFAEERTDLFSRSSRNCLSISETDVQWIDDLERDVLDNYSYNVSPYSHAKSKLSQNYVKYWAFRTKTIDRHHYVSDSTSKQGEMRISLIYARLTTVVNIVF